MNCICERTQACSSLCYLPAHTHTVRHVLYIVRPIACHIIFHNQLPLDTQTHAFRSTAKLSLFTQMNKRTNKNKNTNNDDDDKKYKVKTLTRVHIVRNKLFRNTTHTHTHILSVKKLINWLDFHFFFCKALGLLNGFNNHFISLKKYYFSWCKSSAIASITHRWYNPIVLNKSYMHDGIAHLPSKSLATKYYRMLCYCICVSLYSFDSSLIQISIQRIPKEFTTEKKG